MLTEIEAGILRGEKSSSGSAYRWLRERGFIDENERPTDIGLDALRKFEARTASPRCSRCGSEKHDEGWCHAAATLGQPIETAWLEDDASYRKRLEDRAKLIGAGEDALWTIAHAKDAELDAMGKRLIVPRWTTKPETIALDPAQLEKHDHEMHELACCVRLSVKGKPVELRFADELHTRFVTAGWLRFDVLKVVHTHDGRRAAQDWVREQYRECCEKIPRATIADRVELIEHGKWCRKWFEDVFGPPVEPSKVETAAILGEESLARALFDLQLHEEASQIAEHESLSRVAMLHNGKPLVHGHTPRQPWCQPKALLRVLDIMWERTKPDERAANERFAKTIVEAMRRRA